MNTTAAAAKAHVSTDTVRTWCRTGAVTATKQAGCWIIDSTSLSARIRIGRQITRLRATRLAIPRLAALHAGVRLPALTGTPKQIAWAEDIRARRIRQALDVTPHRALGTAYHLITPGADLLGVNYVRDITPGPYATAADALTALDTVLTCGARTTAAWWINTRAMHTPS